MTTALGAICSPLPGDECQALADLTCRHCRVAKYFTRCSVWSASLCSLTLSVTLPPPLSLSLPPPLPLPPSPVVSAHTHMCGCLAHPQHANSGDRTTQVGTGRRPALAALCANPGTSFLRDVFDTICFATMSKTRRQQPVATGRRQSHMYIYIRHMYIYEPPREVQVWSAAHATT